MPYKHEEEVKSVIYGYARYSADDTVIDEVDEVYKKSKAWQTLKEEMKQDYIATKQVNDEMALRDLALLDDYLRRIDELDGTHEFSNLLDDMNGERE